MPKTSARAPAPMVSTAERGLAPMIEEPAKFMKIGQKSPIDVIVDGAPLGRRDLGSQRRATAVVEIARPALLGR